MVEAIVGVIAAIITGATAIFSYIVGRPKNTQADKEKLAGEIHDAFKDADKSKGDTHGIEDVISNP